MTWQAQDFIAARRRLGLSQVGAAELLGYSRSGIQKIERGEHPVERVVELAMRYAEEHPEIVHDYCAQLDEATADRILGPKR